MSPNVKKQSVLSSLFWKFLERGGDQATQLIVQLVLARLLAPSAFGTIAIVQVFIAFANVFINSGFGDALVQKKEPDDLDYSSVLYFSLFIAAAIYGFIFLSAPAFAGFYSNAALVPVLRVLSLNLFPGALNSVQNAYVAKHLMFRKQFLSSTAAGLLSGIVGIFLAFIGFGVWALVFQQIISQVTVTVILWLTVKWRPSLKFSVKRIRILFAFGSKLLLSGLINTFFDNLITLIIGRRYSPGTLGFHNKGESLPRTLTISINGAIDEVMLPTFASFQDRLEALKNAVRRSIMTSSFLIFPMMIGLAVIAEPLVRLLLTETWLPAVPFIQIYAVTMMFFPIHTTNLQAIKAIGRSDMFLKLEIIKTVLALVVLLISLPFGVIAIAFSSLITTILSIFINAYPNRKFLNYSYKEQMLDLLPAFLLSGAMGLAVYLLNYLTLAVWLKLILQIFTGIIIYFGSAKLFKIEIFEYLLTTSREFLRQRNRK